MTTIAITRNNAPVVDDDWGRVLDVMHAAFEGLRDVDGKAWDRFWKSLKDLEAGEILNLDLVFPRNPRFHRKFFALLQVGFDAWEPPRVRKSWRGLPVQKNFERFRADVTIAAGYFEQTFNLKGKLQLEPKSIKFSKMEEPEFETLYSAVVDVLLQKVLLSYKGRDELDAIVDRILGFVK